METVYDWVTVLIFAGLITLFLQRSAMDDPPDTIWQYLPAAVGCAIANYLGNEGYDLLAVASVIAVAAYTFAILKPFRAA